METGRERESDADRPVRRRVDFSGLPQLSVAERVARGKAARREVPRSSHAVFEPAAHRLDPIELLERQADTRVPELVPIRYGRMLASPFTFYRGAALIMAADLAATPRSGLPRAVLRRRAPLQLRPLRLARAAARLRHQRLRRDAARPVGVGRQAPRGEHADRRTQQRLLGEDQEHVVLETVAAYRTRMARVRRDAQPRGLVHALRDREADAAAPLAGRREDAQAPRQGRRQGAQARQRAGVLEALARRRRRAAHRLRSAADRPARRLPGQRGARSRQGGRWSGSCASTASRSSTSGGSCSTSSGSSTWPARSSVSAASARAAWIALLLGRDGARSALPADQGGTAPRSWRSSSA